MNKYDKKWRLMMSSVFIASLLATFFISMFWFEGSNSWLGHAESWVNRHDLTLDLVTVWSLVIGFAILSVVEFATWVTMVGQQDITTIGARLRHKKLGYSLICFAMCMLYSLSLYAYYQQHQFQPMTVFGLRLLIIVGIVTAAFFGSRFLIAFRREVLTLDARGFEQDIRGKEQDDRGNRQDIRGEEQDERDIAQDDRDSLSPQRVP
jgi:hypothetical protein